MCRAVPRAIVGEAVRGRGWAVVGVAVCAGVDGVAIGGEVGVVVPMGMVAVGMAGVVCVVGVVVVGVVVGVVMDVGVVVVTAECKEPYRHRGAEAAIELAGIVETIVEDYITTYTTVREG